MSRTQPHYPVIMLERDRRTMIDNRAKELLRYAKLNPEGLACAGIVERVAVRQLESEELVRVERETDIEGGAFHAHIFITEKGYHHAED